MNTPWYRPTRVLHAVSGADFGYRNGAGKWPTYYFDSLPPGRQHRPGLADGRDLRLRGEVPREVSGRLLHLRLELRQALRPAPQAEGGDLRGRRRGVHHRLPPAPDRRRRQPDRRGALLRHRRTARRRRGSIGSPTPARATARPPARHVEAGRTTPCRRSGRRRGHERRCGPQVLEAFHGHADPKAVDTAWPFLSNPDRWLRYAARVAIEFQDPATWRERALTETNPQAALEVAAGPGPGQRPGPRPPQGRRPRARPAFQNQILGAPRPAAAGTPSPSSSGSTWSGSAASCSTGRARPTRSTAADRRQARPDRTRARSAS